MTGIIQISSDVLGGAPVFIGTRVPIKTLFDYLEDGDSIDEFLIDFPAVSRDHVVELLADLRKDAVESAKEAA